MSQRKTIAKNKVTDPNISHVHMTGSPAVPDATFVLLKSMDQGAALEGFEDIETTTLFKTDPVKKQVFGYCLVPDKADYQGDVLEKSDVEVACHSLLKNLLQGTTDGEASGVDHKIFKGAHPIESCIDTDGSIAKSHGAIAIPGSWWLGVQVTDDTLWGKIEKGEINGFTVGGKGKRTPITKSEPESVPAIEQAGFFKTLREIWRATHISKADGEAESYNEVKAQQDLRDKLSDMHWHLREALWSVIDDDTVTDKGTPLGASIDQFKTDFIATVQAAQTAKSNATNNDVQKMHTAEGDSAMTPVQVEKLNATMETLSKAVIDLSTAMTAKPPTDPPEGANGKPDGEVKKSITDEADPKLVTTVEALEKTVSDLKDEIAKIKKTPQVRRGVSEPASIKKNEGGEQDEAAELAKSAKGSAWDFSAPKPE